MNQHTNGWENWEDKLNEKTAQRRERREAAHRVRIAQIVKMRRWIFFGVEILLGAVGIALLCSYLNGAIHRVVFQSVIGVVTALMTFCAGYFLGTTNH